MTVETEASTQKVDQTHLSVNSKSVKKRTPSMNKKNSRQNSRSEYMTEEQKKT